jgi:superfamily II DNA helicase RecQ
MNLGQLNETLSQLEKEKCISVAKLRAGRRVKILENKINPEQEKEYCNMVNKKIRVDYAKLDALIKYVQLESNDCRRRDLLSYFGEKYEAENCATCDLCRKTFKTSKPKLTGIEKKILMSVYLAEVNFGKKKLAMLLKGSYELDERFHELDDFASLSKLDIEQISACIDELLDMGFLYIDTGKYPVVKISADGKKQLQEAVSI